MTRKFSRREFLKTSGIAGLGLSTGSLLGCGGNRDLPLGTGASTPGGGTPVPTPAPAPPTIVVPGYKALVNVFLFGGNDGYNMLVPTTPEKYNRYSAARLNLAVAQNQLLPLNGTAADGAAYGVHPSCAELQGLFNGGKAALMANVGSLTFPTTRADYLADRVPPRLFSHNDQQDQWQTVNPQVQAFSGWAGRIADVFSGANSGGEMPLNVSIAGANLMQRGAQTSAFAMSSGGAQQLNQLSATQAGTKNLRAVFDQIRGRDEDHIFERSYSDTLDRGIRINALLDAELSKAPALATAFPADNPLAAQLQMVARLIGIRGALGMNRQTFFVSLGGFDTHDAQLTDHPVLLQRLSQALKAFYDATVELGVASGVTTFTSSDFGRSLTVNGKGTDHGWSNHQWVVGGAVNGAKIYGMPPSMIVGSADDTQGGRFIPSVAVDQYGSTLANWFDVGAGNLNYIFPNLSRFSGSNLGFML